MTRYGRQDILRILRIRPKQLRAWERSGLIACGESYTFRDMVQLRKLRDLRAARLSSASIRASVHAMRSVSGMSNPLLEAGTARSGSRLAFRLGEGMVEPIAGQFVFDFDRSGERWLAEVCFSAASRGARGSRVNALFVEAVGLEERGLTEEAVAAYERILELDASHAPACINLGTIHYNQRRFLEAENFYRRATVSDSTYALAYFDLGNVLDELQRLPEAIEAYLCAIRLAPRYADAHYNLALAYERTGERHKALRHWTRYIHLDPIGPWASHARIQARKILERQKLAVVYRNLSPRVRPARRLPAGDSFRMVLLERPAP